MQNWQENSIPSDDEEIVWYEAGKGKEVLFLHGNWDHVLYMPMLEEHREDFRTILLKQPGADCWKRPGTLNNSQIAPFFAQIERLREHKGIAELIIAGHSWGAMLALEYASTYPSNVGKLVLIGLGPLSDEMAECYRANVRMRIPGEMVERFVNVKQAFGRHFASGKGVPAEVDEEYAEIFSRVWAHSPEKAQEIKRRYLAAGGFRRVAAGCPRSATQEFLERVKRIQCPTLIIYGYQDYEPITQAYTLKEKLPQARISFINRCGHYPWLDQPEESRRLLSEFINE